MLFLIHPESIDAAAITAARAGSRRLKSLDADTDTEVNVKQIETEVGARRGAAPFLDAVGHLTGMGEVQTENAYRHVEADVVHDEHREAGREVEAELGVVGACLARLRVVEAAEDVLPRAQYTLRKFMRFLNST